MRRIYIIPKSMSIEDAKEAALYNNCGEIARGIPPVLNEQVKEEDLPCVYEEPELPQPPEPVDFIKELKKLEKRVKKLEGNKE